MIFSEQQLQSIRTICDRHGVAELYVFGSALDPQLFDPKTSDLDFVIEMDWNDSRSVSDRFFGALQDLESVFSSKIDLTCYSSMKNPFFIQEVEATKVQLYPHAA